jgi:hypothetical protein
MSEPNVLSIIAIGMSGASLFWQALTWTRSGPVVRLHAFLVNSDLTITASNSGRAPVTIVDIGYARSARARPQPLKFSKKSEKLPFRLEAGDTVSFVAEPPGAHRVRSVKVFATLGNGRRAASKTVKLPHWTLMDRLLELFGV